MVPRDKEESSAQKIRPFLGFDDNAEEAVNFYVSLFGDAEITCGWLRDRFGLSWQIVPSVLGELLGGSDPEGSQRAMQAMLKMKKLDIQALQDAYVGA